MVATNLSARWWWLDLVMCIRFTRCMQHCGASGGELEEEASWLRLLSIDE